MSTTSIKYKYEEVLKYYNKVIKGYLVNDIQKLLSKEFDDLEYGGCAAPLAMTVFSAMNQLGYLSSKEPTIKLHKDKDPSQITITEICIKEYFNNWMKKETVRNKELYRKEKVQELIIELYRHGFAHQFISIFPSAITRSSNIKELITISEKSPVLQIKILAEDFQYSLNLLTTKIETSLILDNKFIENFYDRLIIQNDYSAKNNKVINDFLNHKNIPKIPVTTDMTTRIPEVTQSIENQNTKDA